MANPDLVAYSLGDHDCIGTRSNLIDLQSPLSWSHNSWKPLSISHRWNVSRFSLIKRFGFILDSFVYPPLVYTQGFKLSIDFFMLAFPFLLKGQKLASQIIEMTSFPETAHAMEGKPTWTRPHSEVGAFVFIQTIQALIFKIALHYEKVAGFHTFVDSITPKP